MIHPSRLQGNNPVYGSKSESLQSRALLKLPDELEPWIKDEELINSSLSEPGFYEKIPISALQGDSVDSDPNTFVSINDYQHIFDKLVDYIETKWKPWAIEDRELQKVQKAYNQLFNIYQRQEKLGEQYEVIVGAGLLFLEISEQWRNQTSYPHYSSTN